MPYPVNLFLTADDEDDEYGHFFRGDIVNGHGGNEEYDDDGGSGNDVMTRR